MLHVSKVLHSRDDKLTSNVASVKYCLGTIFNKEHDSAGAVICLNKISTLLLQIRELYV